MGLMFFRAENSANQKVVNLPQFNENTLVNSWGSPNLEALLVLYRLLDCLDKDYPRIFTVPNSSFSILELGPGFENAMLFSNEEMLEKTGTAWARDGFWQGRAVASELSAQLKSLANSWRAQVIKGGKLYAWVGAAEA